MSPDDEIQKALEEQAKRNAEKSSEPAPAESEPPENNQDQYWCVFGDGFAVRESGQILKVNFLENSKYAAQERGGISVDVGLNTVTWSPYIGMETRFGENGALDVGLLSKQAGYPDDALANLSNPAGTFGSLPPQYRNHTVGLRNVLGAEYTHEFDALGGELTVDGMAGLALGGNPLTNAQSFAQNPFSNLNPFQNFDPTPVVNGSALYTRGFENNDLRTGMLRGSTSTTFSGGQFQADAGVGATIFPQKQYTQDDNGQTVLDDVNEKIRLSADAYYTQRFDFDNLTGAPNQNATLALQAELDAGFNEFRLGEGQKLKGIFNGYASNFDTRATAYLRQVAGQGLNAGFALITSYQGDGAINFSFNGKDSSFKIPKGIGAGVDLNTETGANFTVGYFPKF